MKEECVLTIPIKTKCECCGVEMNLAEVDFGMFYGEVVCTTCVFNVYQ